MDDRAGILGVDWNQDDSCFTLATERGFFVYQAEPQPSELAFRSVGGVRRAVLLQRSSLLALVGGGHSPAGPPNKVLLWDDVTRRIVAEVEFRTPVLGLALRHARLLCATRDAVHVLALDGNELCLLRALPTADNPKGVLAVATHHATALVAVPGRPAGHVHLHDVSVGGGNIATGAGGERGVGLGPGARTAASAVPPVPAPAPAPAPLATPPAAMIAVHKHALAALALSRNGQLVASASETGTIIRVHTVRTRTCIYSFRRGLASADIHAMRFSADAGLLAVASDRTCHVWSLQDPAKNPKPVLGTLLDLLVTGSGSSSDSVGGVGRGGGGGGGSGGGAEESTSAARAMVTHSTPAPGTVAFSANGKAILCVCSDATWHRLPIKTSDGAGTTHEDRAYARLLKPDTAAIFRLEGY